MVQFWCISRFFFLNNIHSFAWICSSPMTLSTKKANCGDPIGRISDLPSNFINGILDHLNARDLVRTSVLSRKWRYMWITVPRLKFCRDFYCRYEDLEDPGPEVSRIIIEILFLHNGSIYTFILRLPSSFQITS
jgi:hypothetical protein